MMNLISWLAVRIKLPDWEFDWADKKPQRSRKSLNISDFLPSEQEFGELKKKEQFITLLVSWYKNTKICSNCASLSTSKPLFTHLHLCPLKVLFKDEKYIAETVEILSTLMDLDEENRVHVQYQLTGQEPQHYVASFAVVTTTNTHSTCLRT